MHTLGSLAVALQTFEETKNEVEQTYFNVLPPFVLSVLSFSNKSHLRNFSKSESVGISLNFRFFLRILHDFLSLFLENRYY